MVFRKAGKIIRRRLGLLADPVRGAERLYRYTFERSLSEYFVLLGFLSLLSAIFVFLAGVFKSVFYDLFYDVDIHYWNMFNYSVGRATGTLFLYLFLGTFGVFALSMLLNPFLKSTRYVKVLQLCFISLSPALLFGWIPGMALPLLLWGAFIFIAARKPAVESRQKSTRLDARD